MIKNQKQAGIVKERLAELLSARDELISKKLTFKENEVEYNLGLDSFNALITELDSDLKIYQSLVDGSFYCFEPKSLDEIPEILISARLAKKISQRELAELIGTQEQQIQRYEAANYETASWHRIIEVAIALGLKISFNKIFVTGVKKPEFIYPEGVSSLQADNGNNKIKKEKQLFTL